MPAIIRPVPALDAQGLGSARRITNGHPQANARRVIGFAAPFCAVRAVQEPVPREAGHVTRSRQARGVARPRGRDARPRRLRAGVLGLPEREDKVALSVPVGFAFGEDVESGKTWAVHPTLLLTGPVNSHLEVNGSLKGLIPLSKDGGDTLVAFNVGLGVGDLEKWVIRPEVGFLFNPGESGHFTQFGIGLTIFAGGRKPS